MKILIDNGYEYEIGPDGKVLYIHRKVMEEKLGRKLEPGEVVHHIDENKRNNDPDNLELTNKSEHSKMHYYKQSNEWKETFKYSNPLGLGKKVKGSKHGNSKLDEEKVKHIKRLLIDGQSQSSIARLYNVDHSTIREIKFERSWKHVTI